MDLKKRLLHLLWIGQAPATECNAADREMKTRPQTGWAEGAVHLLRRHTSAEQPLSSFDDSGGRLTRLLFDVF